MWLWGWILVWFLRGGGYFVARLCVCVFGVFSSPTPSISNCLHLSIQFVIPGKTKETIFLLI